MPANTVTQEQIKAVLSKAEKIVQHRVFGKCTVVMVKLPNGFVIVESTGCVDPANYDEAIGERVCMERIESKVWELLEGYVLANRLAGIDPEREARLAARREKRRQKAKRQEANRGYLRDSTKAEYNPCPEDSEQVKISMAPDCTTCPGGTTRDVKVKELG